MAHSIGDDVKLTEGNRAGERPSRRSVTTRRGIQVVLGLLWLLDGILQLQPFMFTAEFAQQILARSGQDQPAWVAAPIDFFAGIVADHPAQLNVGFALIQLALGVGFLVPRLVRPAIVVSVAWAAVLWWFAEGFGGLVTGTASVVTGAPGAVLLYGVLALAVWPPAGDRTSDEPDERAIAGWFPVAWFILWVGAAILQLLPSQRGTAALQDQLGSADGTPGWLTSLHDLAGAVVSHGGSTPFVALVVVMVLIGVGGLGRPPWRTVAAVAGALVSTTFWVLGQNIGELYSGQATDPNTGPLIVLMAVALIGSTTGVRLPTGKARGHGRIQS
jgi:hypothetical protein